MKNRFPFRLGTTSYILHDDILPNVHFLKDKVDHIELLVFETDEESNYPSPALIDELKAIASDNGLSYSVHLPLGVKLGSAEERQRSADVATILRAIDATRPLNPIVWDLHLEQNDKGEQLDEAWQAACVQSLEELKKQGADPACTGIENLEFGYQVILPILDQTGFAATLDMGHVWYASGDEDFYLDAVLPRAVSVHIHGFDEERDHKGLHTIEKTRLKRFLEALCAQPQAARLPVSIEVFSRRSFDLSLEALNGII